MTQYTEDQIAAFYAELKRQAAVFGDGKKFSGFSWGPLDQIAGKRAFEVFDILRQRGMLETRVIPHTYGHSEYTLLA